MSGFLCEYCGAMAMDTGRGYISGCEHHKPDVPTHALTTDELRWLIDARNRGALIDRPDLDALEPSLRALGVPLDLPS